MVHAIAPRLTLSFCVVLLTIAATPPTGLNHNIPVHFNGVTYYIPLYDAPS